MNPWGLAREELTQSIDDCVRIVRKRWFVGTMLFLLAVGVTELAYVAWRSADAAFYAALPVIWVISFTIYADSVRSVLRPDFRLDAVRALRLVGLTVLCFGSAIAATIAIVNVSFAMLSFAFHFSPWPSFASSSVFYATLTYCGARLVFACYLIGDRGVWGAAAGSWRLTKGPTFLVTLCASAAYDLVWFAIWPGIQSLQKVVDPTIVLAVRSAVDFAFLFTITPVAYVFFARWMLIASAASAPRPQPTGP